MPIVLQMTNVSRTFTTSSGALTILEDVNLRIPSGTAVALQGPSGCGKSTLLYLLAGLRQPNEGGLLVDGTPVSRPRASTGLILQNHGLLPWATVWENAALGIRIGHFYAHKRDRPDEPLSPRDGRF